MKEEFVYLKFAYPNTESFNAFKALFLKMREYKNQSDGLEEKDYEDVNWEEYLTQEAKEWFSHRFDFHSEEGQVYMKLWELTSPVVRERSLKLIPPGHNDFDSVTMTVFSCDYHLVALEEQEGSIAFLYLYPGGYPFGGTESLWELLRAFGNEIIFDSYLGGKPPETVSEWDYELAKKLVQQNKGLYE